MFVCALRIELHFPDVHTLKEKRARVTPVIEGLQRRFHVAAAETAFQDKWQRAEIGVAAVAGSVAHLERVLDECERFVWSFPEHEVTRCERTWLEE